LKNNNWQTESFMLDHANEQTLKKILSPTILHVATHGFFLSDVELTDETQEDSDQSYRKNPLFRSGILLAGAGLRLDNSEEDGVLTAYEALNLNLDKTELVSLSACETGLGEVRNGEGVYGLQRSFLVAGAKAVLMSLWQVDDQATQELMDHFYQYWFAGKTKTDAFREAQIKLKEKYQYPYFWGAFVMIGN
jgi:CHAT domain-containing protein